jgi:hypothetical protein
MTQEIGNDILEKKATLYEWCQVNNFRLDDEDKLDADVYMTKEISLSEFKEILDIRGFEKQTQPRKPEKYLELRMYGLVPYNLSDIQKGIQFNHANDVYGLEWGKDNQQYDWFRTQWMTNILLNGGTSNEGHNVRQGFKEVWYVGSMQQHLADLKANDIKVSTFYEPDLNSMLTAIVFLVDERVFNKELYPDYEPIPFEGETDAQLVEWSIQDTKRRAEWVNLIGGPKNEFLREFLRGKRLA